MHSVRSLLWWRVVHAVTAAWKVSLSIAKLGFLMRKAVPTLAPLGRCLPNRYRRQERISD